MRLAGHPDLWTSVTSRHVIMPGWTIAVVGKNQIPLVETKSGYWKTTFVSSQNNIPSWPWSAYIMDLMTNPGGHSSWGSKTGTMMPDPGKGPKEHMIKSILGFLMLDYLLHMLLIFLLFRHLKVNDLQMTIIVMVIGITFYHNTSYTNRSCCSMYSFI